MIPRNSTTRPPGVEERRRVEEQEEEQDHRKDPGFARPITLATTSSFGVGVLCEYFARFSFSRPGTGSRGPSALVPRSDAWDLAPLTASSRRGPASCGGMRREPDVPQEFNASGPSQVLREP